MKPKEIKETLQLLCEKILVVGAVYTYNSNGPDTTHCPFCFDEAFSDRESMDTLTHEEDCAYVIAKKTDEEIAE